jgi:formamidopyrimidine-DNA glycosylase
MPELPEVETVKNELMPHVLGREVTGVDVLWEGTVCQPPVEEFRSRIIGQRITGLSRRGKYLLFELSSGDILIVHMKMSGSLLFNPSDDKYNRAIIHLDGGVDLYFRDPRKFGKMWLVEDKETVVGKLGPEALGDDFTYEVLAERLENRKAPVKTLLCDQAFLAGLGNMYADESLFVAGIHPLREGGSLSKDEIEQLYGAIRQVLRAAIDNKGASIVNYFRPGGDKGTAHFEFKVAHRGGEPCPRCGTTIQRIPVRNRGSYFCPRCQPG